MTKHFEDDELLNSLGKAAGKKEVPELNETIIHSAVTADLKFGPRKLATPRLLVSLAGSAAVLAVTAILVSSNSPRIIELYNLESKSGIEFLSSADGRASSMPTGDESFDIFIPIIKATQSGLSANPGKGVVYRARNTQKPEDLLYKLANYFGVKGSPVQRDGYQEIIGDELQTRGSAYVSTDGSLSFTYLNASSESKTPKVEMSRENALKVFTDFGLNVSLDEIHLRFNRAVAYVRVGNQESPVKWTIVWGPDKRIYSFSGFAVEFNPVLEVKTISPSEAFDRLNILSWGEGHVVVLHEDRVDPISPRNLIESCRPFDSEACEVKVTSSEPSLGYTQDAKGQLWLVPSHSYYVGGVLAGGTSALPEGNIESATISKFPNN
jgi:hypothetical protein